MCSLREVWGKAGPCAGQHLDNCLCDAERLQCLSCSSWSQAMYAAGTPGQPAYETHLIQVTLNSVQALPLLMQRIQRVASHVTGLLSHLHTQHLPCLRAQQ